MLVSLSERQEKESPADIRNHYNQGTKVCVEI